MITELIALNPLYHHHFSHLSFRPFGPISTDQAPQQPNHLSRRSKVSYDHLICQSSFAHIQVCGIFQCVICFPRRYSMLLGHIYQNRRTAETHKFLHVPKTINRLVISSRVGHQIAQPWKQPNRFFLILEHQQKLHQSLKRLQPIEVVVSLLVCI